MTIVRSTVVIEWELSEEQRTAARFVASSLHSLGSLSRPFHTVTTFNSVVPSLLPTAARTDLIFGKLLSQHGDAAGTNGAASADELHASYSGEGALLGAAVAVRPFTASFSVTASVPPLDVLLPVSLRR
jgi:hypothetical protein